MEKEAMAERETMAAKAAEDKEIGEEKDSLKKVLVKDTKGRASTAVRKGTKPGSAEDQREPRRQTWSNRNRPKKLSVTHWNRGHYAT